MKNKANKTPIRHPGTVKRIVCADCGELLCKVYPWAVVMNQVEVKIGCGKCINDKNKKAQLRLPAR